MSEEIKKNYTPRSIAFVDFAYGETRTRRKTISMEVDEKKAIQILQTMIAEGRKIERAELGLDGDWRENNTEIYDGKTFHPYDSYHGSLWATPMLIVYFEDAPSEAYECWYPENRRT